MKKSAIFFILIGSVVYSQDPYDFRWNHSYNSNGTKSITITLTLETHMPVDERVTLEFWKSGAENSPNEQRAVPWYAGGASGRSFAIMSKIGSKQWQVTVELDTTLVSANATSQSLYHYFYGRNTGNSENKVIEYSRTGDMSNVRKLDFGWHTKTPLVRQDTLKAWFAWPTDGVIETINTSTYLSTPATDLNTTTFMAGGGMNDFWRSYWNPFIGNYLDNMVRNLNANWIMFVPGPKIIQHHPTVKVIRDHDVNSMPEQDIKKVITEAHKRGLKVFWYSLAPGYEEGNYDHSKVDAAWYVDYANAMRPEIIWQATLAETHGVEMIGFAPYPTSQLKDEHIATIDSVAEVILNEVRAIYSGKITMSWVNETPELDIYGKVDYLNNALETYGLQNEGLTNTSNPSVSDLLQPMRNKVGKMKSAYTKYGKPFVYSFIQSASYDGMVAANTVITEANEEYLPDDTNYPLDFQEQADGIEAMQQVIGENDWIAGAFYFNYKEWAVNWKTWNLRGKPAEKVAAKWWRWRSPNNVHLTTSINNQWTTSPYQKGGTTSLSPGSYIYANGTTVNVSAIPDSGYRFVKWAGDASGSSKSISIMMNTDQSISALFEANPGPDPSDLVPPGPFDLVYPFDGTTIVLTTDNFLDTLYFAWNQSVDPGGDDVNYSRELTGDLPKYIRFVVPSDEKITTNMYKVPYHAIERYMHRASVEFISGTWTIVATDGTHNVYAENGPFTLTIDGSKLEVGDNDLIPEKFALYANYPNPFNPTTTISYDLSEQAQVTLGIYDILGKQIKTLVNQSQDAGNRTVFWDGRDDLGRTVSAGVYLYQIKAGEFTQTRKMLLLK